jgi:hypothetical protein
LKKPDENGRTRKAALIAAVSAAIAVLVLAMLLLLPEREAAAGSSVPSPGNSGRFEDARAKAAEGMRFARKYMYDAKTGCGVEEEFARACMLLDDAVRILSELVREHPDYAAAESLLKEAVAVRNDVEKFHSSMVKVCSTGNPPLLS